MPKAKTNKKRSWLYQAKITNVRKRIKRAEHKATRKLEKEDLKEETLKEEKNKEE
jgi:hypothetical protein